jgi:hypothetical protein
MKKIFCMLFLLTLIGSSVFAITTPVTPPGALSFLPSFLALIVIIIVIMLIRTIIKRGNTLVLQEFKLDENEDEFLIIKVRHSGFLGWIFSLCGIDSVTSLICNKHTIKCEMSAIRYGKETYNIPLVGVSCVSSGIKKPFQLIVFGILFILTGMIAGNFAPPAFAGVLIWAGIISLILYRFNKAMQFNIYTGGNKPIVSIAMKRSIIEGQNIDSAKYEAAANVLNKAVLSAKGIKNGK